MCTSPSTSSIGLRQARLVPSMFIAHEPQILSARPAEGQGGVDLVFDFHQRVQDHRPAFVEIDFVAIHPRVIAGIGVVAINFKGLHPLGVFGRLIGGAVFDLELAGNANSAIGTVF